MIGLCDCNNFFVSCERLFNPALEGRPVVVMSSNDGCVVARSNEAKALGIKMSQPMFQLRDLIHRHGVVALSSNLQLYGDISNRVMMTLRDALPAIEQYSIDEAFLDLSGLDHEVVEEFCRDLSRTIRRNTGIPVSIGIAPTKSLAKVAAKLCKSYPKLRGACYMWRAEDIAKVLNSYAVGDVWGIGRRSRAMLADYNIKTAGDFRNTPKEWVQSKMGIVGVRTWRELWGESCIDLDLSRVDRQSIMVSRSFHHDIGDVDELSRLVATFASLATEKLRRQRSVASQVEVFAATNRFREDLVQHSCCEVLSFATPTDSTLEIVKAASDRLRSMVRAGCSYKKVGVVLRSISDRSGVQSSMFDTLDRDKHHRLMSAMDRLNRDMGRSTINVGSLGDGIVPTSSDNRSPMYTTLWSDIMRVKV